MKDRINLTAKEWMSLINKEGKNLQICCGNISAFRDIIISMARENGEVSPWDELDFFQRYGDALSSHPEMADNAVIQKLVSQVEKITGKKADDYIHGTGKALHEHVDTFNLKEQLRAAQQWAAGIQRSVDAILADKEKVK
jgi:hypothetical protein